MKEIAHVFDGGVDEFRRKDAAAKSAKIAHQTAEARQDGQRLTTTSNRQQPPDAGLIPPPRRLLNHPRKIRSASATVRAVFSSLKFTKE